MKRCSHCDTEFIEMPFVKNNDLCPICRKNYGVADKEEKKAEDNNSTYEDFISNTPLPQEVLDQWPSAVEYVEKMRNKKFPVKKVLVMLGLCILGGVFGWIMLALTPVISLLMAGAYLVYQWLSYENSTYYVLEELRIGKGIIYESENGRRPYSFKESILHFSSIEDLRNYLDCEVEVIYDRIHMKILDIRILSANIK